jgi:hypothetical protein
MGLGTLLLTEVIATERVCFRIPLRTTTNTEPGRHNRAEDVGSGFVMPPRPLPFHQGNDFAQVIHDGFQFGNGFARQVLRFRQYIAVLERFISQPGNIQLVLAISDFANVETPKTTTFTGVFSLAVAVAQRVAKTPEFIYDV